MFIIFVKMIWFSDKLKHLYGTFIVINIITCRVVCVMKMTGSSSDDWIYWHFSYKFS
jgi:hypothetical protein